MIEPKDNLSPDQSFAPPPPPWRQNAYNQPAMPTPPMPLMAGNFSGGQLPGVGDLLSQSWRIFISNAGTFIGIIVLPFIVQMIAGAVLFFFLLGGLFIGGLQSLSSPSSLVPKITSVSNLILLVVVGLIMVLINVLSQAALVHTSVHRERRITLSEAYGFAFGKLPSYLLVTILSTIIIGGGMFLFVVPGILFAVWFMLAVFIVMSEDARGMSALFKSREYMKGNGIAVVWRLLAVAIILGIAFIAIYLGFSFISKVVDFWIIKLIAGLILFFAPFVLQPIATALIAIYTALIYDYLRAARPISANAPSVAQKAIFLGIGILGLIIPVIAFFAAAGPILSLITKSQTGMNMNDVSIFSPDTALAKQRDTRRLTDIKSIQNGLELYFVDYNGYPVVASPVVLGGNKATRLNANGWVNSASTGDPVYMIKVPSNPAPGGSDYIYASTDASGAPCTQGPSCAAYTITFKLESGAGGYKAGELIATPPDVIMETPEALNGLKNPQYNANSSLIQDADKDGLSDSVEKVLGTNSKIFDTDFDGLSDGDEVNIWKTKPINPDTDGDGFRDGDEAKNGYNPLGNGKTENN